MSEQSAAQTADRPWWQFKPGVSGNPGGHRARMARIAAKASEIAGPLGGFDRLSALDREYLTKAATLLIRRARNAAEERTAIKAARSLILDVERRRAQVHGGGAVLGELKL